MINPKKLKRSSHPVMFFIYMSLLVIIISAIASALNFQVTYDQLTTIAGEVESKRRIAYGSKYKRTYLRVHNFV